jgi:hypothetical protein
MLHSFAESAEPRAKHVEAEQLWKLAKALRVPFNAHAMQAFIKACRSTKGDENDLREAFKLVGQVFRDAEESALDSIVYSELLEACHRLVPNDDRNEGFEAFFKHCVAHGNVGTDVLRQLRKLCPPDLYTRLTGQDPLHKPTMKDIPAKWKRKFSRQKRVR